MLHCMFNSGYGIFALKDFTPGEFIVEYVGKLIDPRVADEYQDQTFLYYFSLSSKNYW